MSKINSLGFLGQFYFIFKDKFKRIYQNSNFYEKKISKTFNDSFEYKPSPHILSSIIKYQKKNTELKILQLILFGKVGWIKKILKN